ncbi:MAG: LON peptidase substrate-binding domain-containing protein [Polyangiaceae bacterium]|jgi:Lon protease-like protein
MIPDELPADLAGALDDLPVFPLPHAVLFPRGKVPLHIFEPRYRSMVAYCMASHHGMVLARISSDAAVDEEGRPRFDRIAGLGLIVHHQALPGGRSNIVLQGKARVAIEERASGDPFRRVRATVLRDEGLDVSASDRRALVALASMCASELRARTDLEFTVPPDAPPDALADLCAQYLLLDADARQAMLDERDVAARVKRVIAALAVQRQALGDLGGNRVLN